MDMAAAALRAIEAQVRSGPGYLWGERDCTTLIEALCAELGTLAPDYGPVRSRSELRATIWTSRKYGSLARAHQIALEATNRWIRIGKLEQLDAPMCPGDVVSLESPVHTRMGVYEPNNPRLQLTGIVGPDSRPWTWHTRGLQPCDSWAGVAALTRYRQCQ